MPEILAVSLQDTRFKDLIKICASILLFALFAETANYISRQNCRIVVTRVRKLVHKIVVKYVVRVVLSFWRVRWWCKTKYGHNLVGVNILLDKLAEWVQLMFTRITQILPPRPKEDKIG